MGYRNQTKTRPQPVTHEVKYDKLEKKDEVKPLQSDTNAIFYKHMLDGTDKTVHLPSHPWIFPIQQLIA